MNFECGQTLDSLESKDCRYTGRRLDWAWILLPSPVQPTIVDKHPKFHIIIGESIPVINPPYHPSGLRHNMYTLWHWI